MCIFLFGSNLVDVGKCFFGGIGFRLRKFKFVAALVVVVAMMKSSAIRKSGIGVLLFRNLKFILFVEMLVQYFFLVALYTDLSDIQLIELCRHCFVLNQILMNLSIGVELGLRFCIQICKRF